MGSILPNLVRDLSGSQHPGIWSLFAQLQVPQLPEEVLDWFHLMENLYKVGGSLKRLHQAETLLWRGRVDQTLAFCLS